MKYYKFLVLICSLGLFASTKAQVATNGLNNPTSGSIGLGGTLSNAQTSIDFGSSNSSSSLLIKKGTSNYLVVDNAGNVGVGTNSPLMKFYVNGNSRFDGSAYVVGTSNGSTFFVQKYSIGVNSFASFDDLDGGGYIKIKGGSSNGFYPSIAMKPDGTVQNTAAITVYVSDVSSSSAALRLDARPVANNAPLANKNILEVGSYTSTYLSVKANGNLGLGITSPTAYLNIKAGTASVNTAPLKFTSGALLTTPEAGAIEFDGTHLYFTATNGGTRYQLDQSGGGTNYWTLAGANISYASGNVAIGTTDGKGYKFAVNGDAIFTKILVKQYINWADYVFNANYNLPTLAEVEKYILQYKHLPDVPSAEEVEKNGLDIGDNQATLLKKIEELTLYVIEQNKKDQEQQKRIEWLEKEINILKENQTSHK